MPPLDITLAVLAPLIAAVLLGVYAAPKSARRLSRGPRVALEMAVFAGACAALVIAGAPFWAITLAVLVVLNAGLLIRWEQ